MFVNNLKMRYSCQTLCAIYVTLTLLSDPSLLQTLFLFSSPLFLSLFIFGVGKFLSFSFPQAHKQYTQLKEASALSQAFSPAQIGNFSTINNSLRKNINKMLNTPVLQVLLIFHGFDNVLSLHFSVCFCFFFSLSRSCFNKSLSLSLYFSSVRDFHFVVGFDSFLGRSG